MLRPSLTYLILLMFIAFPLALAACGGGDDTGAFDDGARDYDPDDDDYGPFDDDDDGPGDDDDGNDDDDDDGFETCENIDGPCIAWLIPENNSTIPVREVLLHGHFQLVGANDIEITEIVNGQPVDRTPLFNIQDDERIFTSSITLAQGVHTFEAKAPTSGKGTVKDTVTFTVNEGGAYISLVFSDYTIDAGDSTTATTRVYDENDSDVTDQAVIDYHVEPMDGVSWVNDDFTFLAGGIFKVTASTTWQGTPLEDFKVITVSDADAVTLDITLDNYTIAAGETVFAEGVVYDSNDNPVVGAKVFFHASPPFGVSWDNFNGNTTYSYGTFESAGEFEITGTVVGTSIMDTEMLTVETGQPWDMDLTLAEPSILLPSGGQVAITPVVEVFDQYGNSMDVPYGLDVFPTGPTVDDTAGTITFDDNAGHGGVYQISAYVIGHATVNDSETLVVETTNDVDIVFTYPPRGFVTTTSAIPVTGYIVDCDLNHTLYVNDEYTVFDAQCQFTYSYNASTGLNIIEARVEDQTQDVVAWGSTSVLKGPFIADDAMISDMVYLGMTEGGFAMLGDVVNQLIDDMNIPAIIMAMNPIFDEEEEFWGVTLASARAEVTDVSLGDLSIYFDISQTGTYLYTEIIQHDIRLDFRVRGQIIGIGYSITGYVETAGVTVEANTNLSINNGQIVTDVATLGFDIAQLNIDIDDFPDDLEDMFEDDITDIIEDVASDALVSEVPDILADLIGQIPMNYTFPITLPDGNTVDVNVVMEPTDITTNANGDAFTFAMNSQIVMDHVSPVPPAMPGSLQTPGNPPVGFGQYIYGTSNDYHLGLYLGDDIFNQALYNIYRAGAMSLDLDNVFRTSDVGAGLLLPAGLIAQYPDHAINIKFRPLLPPVILVGQGGMAVGLPAALQMGDMMLHCFVVDNSGVEQLFLTMALSFDVPMGLDIPFPSNTLEVTLDTPQVVVDLVSDPIADFDSSLLEVIAPYLVEQILPVVVDLFEGIEIPTFSGYGLQVLQMFPIGQYTDYVTIWTDFIAP